jgi:SAM-dependent methyltransferase
MNYAWQSLGKLIAWSDRFIRAVKRHPTKVGMPSPDTLDETGRVVKNAQSPTVLRHNDLVFCQYRHDVAHSFWRAQELSLFNQHKHLLQSPIVDLGCGDGSFGEMVFEQVDVGIDPDWQALCQVHSSVYRLYVNGYGNHLPFKTNSIATLVSNSVLEHVTGLPEIIGEVHRILKMNGLFIFTVPLLRFSEDLVRFTGVEDSTFFNNRLAHRNLFSASYWQSLLRQAGFDIATTIEYQPASFTRLYRVLQSPVPARVGRLLWLKPAWRLLNRPVFNVIDRSIKGSEPGGNLFVVARKKSIVDDSI